MIIVFIIFAVIIALVMQKLTSGKCLDDIEEDHWPESRIVEPDEVFDIVITVKNHGRRFVPFLRVREHVPEGFVIHKAPGNIRTNDMYGGSYVTFTTWLRPKQKLQQRISVSISNRGRYVMKELGISGGDFLGLKEQERTYNRYNEVVVAPREAPDQSVDEVFGGFMGDVSVSRFIFEDPVLTLGYREYTGREPMKMISWSQSSRGNGLMVKKYDYTLEPAVSVMLDVDTDDEKKMSLLEKCFSITRTVCGLLEEKGIKYDFRTNAVAAGAISDLNFIQEGLGTVHFYSVLESLGRASYVSIDSLHNMVEKVQFGTNNSNGRILILAGETDSKVSDIVRLRELSGGNLLIINASEVAEW